MGQVIKVLQIGQTDWSQSYALPDNLKWFYSDSQDLTQNLETIQAKSSGSRLVNFNAVLLLDRTGIGKEDLMQLSRHVDAHAFFYRQGLTFDTLWQNFIFEKQARSVDISQPEKIIDDFSWYLFSNQSGIGMGIENFQIGLNYHNQYQYLSSNWLELTVDSAEEFQPLGSFRYNFYSDPQRRMELWPEYETVGDCELEFTVRLGGQVSDLYRPTYIFRQEALQKPFMIPKEVLEEREFMSVTVAARGQGKVRLGQVYYYWSRANYGQILPGGQLITVKDKHQEFLALLNPGNLKPPLNVYFSGYKTAKQFEGYYMMRSFKHPFLLIADVRDEGGAFYIGSEEFESQITKTIQKALDQLGFSDQDLILSGLSMGTYGALYYASHFRPRAVVVGKPITNLGTVAQRMALHRPEEFGTSLDFLLELFRDSSDPVKDLDNYFWDNFAQGDFSQTTFAVAYMKNDDYDITAYHDLLKHLHQQKSSARIIGKGYLGRHNDNSLAIIQWFKAQYRALMEGEQKQ